MFDFVRGYLAHKDPSTAVVDVGGVGFSLVIPNSTFDRLGQAGEEVTLFTRLVHREDSMDLYGFATPAERSMFDLLMSVSGVGAKLAVKILDGMRVAELAEAIRSRDHKRLTSIPGIGRKGAEKICIELETKVAKIAISTGETARGPSGDAVDALSALGFSRNEAADAIKEVLAQTDIAETSELIRAALAKLSSKK